jgi:cytidine deaminase
MTEIQKKLFEAALVAQKFSHSPYSKARIGAAVLLSNGKIFSGCNVENASYGGTVCAERVAIWKAVSETAQTEISEILVISDADEPWPPCGFCRQVIAEFAGPKTQVHTANPQGKWKSFSFADIFPESFNPSFLKS